MVRVQRIRVWILSLDVNHSHGRTCLHRLRQLFETDLVGDTVEVHIGQVGILADERSKHVDLFSRELAEAAMRYH